LYFLFHALGIHDIGVLTQPGIEPESCFIQLFWQGSDLSRGPNFLTPYVQTDGNLITSRWFNESQIFAERFAEMLEENSR
jgi:hypothetical protein